MRTKRKMIIYPTGDFETYVTLDELKAAHGDPRISYEILESQQFIPSPDCSRPLKDFIEEYYYRRLRLKNDQNPIERAIKVILNSMYGKMA